MPADIITEAINKSTTIFKEETTSALAGFHVGPLFWNLEMLVFVEGGKPENPEKHPRSKARTSNKLNPRMAPGQNRTKAELVGAKRSHHSTFPTPQPNYNFTIIVRYGELFMLDYRRQSRVHTSNTFNDFEFQSHFTRMFSPRKRTQESPG